MSKYKILYIPSGESSIIERDTIPTWGNLFIDTNDECTRLDTCQAYWKKNRCTDDECNKDKCPFHEKYKKIEAEYLIEEITDD